VYRNHSVQVFSLWLIVSVSGIRAEPGPRPKTNLVHFIYHGPRLVEAKLHYVLANRKTPTFGVFHAENDHSYTESLHKKWTNHRFSLCVENCGVKQHWLTPHSRKWGSIDPLTPCFRSIWLFVNALFTVYVFCVIVVVFVYFCYWIGYY